MTDRLHRGRERARNLRKIRTMFGVILLDLIDVVFDVGGICGKDLARHAKGATCRDGTPCVPEGYRPCCDVFESHTRSCAFDVRYEWSSQHGWRIAIDELAGGGGVAIVACPHCGTRLAS